MKFILGQSLSLTMLIQSIIFCPPSLEFKIYTFLLKELALSVSIGSIPRSLLNILFKNTSSGFFNFNMATVFNHWEFKHQFEGLSGGKIPSTC